MPARRCPGWARALLRVRLRALVSVHLDAPRRVARAASGDHTRTYPEAVAFAPAVSRPPAPQATTPFGVDGAPSASAGGAQRRHRRQHSLAERAMVCAARRAGERPHLGCRRPQRCQHLAAPACLGTSCATPRPVATSRGVAIAIGRSAKRAACQTSSRASRARLARFTCAGPLGPLGAGRRRTTNHRLAPTPAASPRWCICLPSVGQWPAISRPCSCEATVAAPRR
jgi:hypothetical protein